MAAGLLLAVLGGATLAQQPLATSPTAPTPYSWPNYHAGGGFLDSAAAGTQYLLPDTYSFSNPFSWQLGGTPTGLDAAGTAQTEIPSFLLGNYVPALGPSGNTIASMMGPNYFNHFRDGTVYNISGPFTFADVNIGSAAITVDDLNANNGGTAYPASNSYGVFGTWTTVSAGTNPTFGDYGSATDAEFQYQAVTYSTSGAAAPTAAATWIVSPTYTGSPTGYTAQAGYYTLSVHVPNVEAATTTNAAGATIPNTITQVFSTDAHYIVLLNPVGTVTPLTASTSPYKIADVRINQTTTNTQTLAGPILLAATDRLYVILDNSTLVQSQSTSTVPTVVAADSITLQQNTGGDVESAPASVNDTEYNEIRNAEYYGIDVGTGSGTALAPGTPPATTTTPDGTPRGNQTIAAFGKAYAPANASAANHEIRQLVYFGRLETIPVLENTGGVITAARNTTTGQVITQQVGAIYCMDGLTGGIVWRYQTPGTYNATGNQTSSSGAVFSSPALARINVRVDPTTGATNPYATKLVVVIGDNRGFVYCLDAVGDRDGTSNTNAVYQLATATPAGTANAGNTTTDPALSDTPILSPTLGLNPATGQINVPIYPNYTGFGDFGSTTNAADPPHEGNTTAYWVYRPDPTQPKYVTGTAAQIGTVKTTGDPNSDLPVPGAFGPASPTIYVNGETETDTTTDIPSATPNGSANITSSNAIVYIGNSNGVLYALDALGFPVTLKTSAAGVKYLDSATTTIGYQTPAKGDAFNTVLDVEDKLAAATGTTTYIPTPAPIWWFSLRGAVNSATNTSTADIESAPAVLVEKPSGNATGKGTTPPVITVYVTSAHEDDADGNSGRLYALDGNYGPSGDNGLTNLKYTGATYQGPGSFDYNIGQRPQLPQVISAVQALGTATSDPYHWSFPDEYGQGQSSNKNPRPALGNMYGSPVDFADPNDLVADPIIGGTATHPRVRIYVAANTGPEVPYDATGTNNVAAASDDNTTGRVWAVNVDGSITKTTAASQDNGWSYPKAWDPNDAAHENTAELSPPIGAFLHAAPAIGVVQFPATIIEGNGGTYNPTDAKYTGGIDGQDVSMLYIASSGQDDALDNGPGFYSLDIDGVNTASTEAAGTQDDNKEIEAIPSPTGETFVSSSALVVNTSTATGTAAGNGGDVFVTGSNGTLFEFGATPITNNFADGTTEPYFPVDASLTGFSAISSPGLTAGNVTDLTTTKTTADARDYVYVGYGNGLCYGITPAGPDTIVGGGFDPGTVGPAPGIGTGPAVGEVSNQFQLYTYVADPNATTGLTKSTTAIPSGASSPTSLSAYEWGDNIYVRISNVIPPTGYKVFDDTNNSGAAGDYYSNGSPVTFTLSATSPRGGGTTTTTTTPPPIPATVITSLPGDGFIVGTDANINPAGKLTTDNTGTGDGGDVFIAATSFPVNYQEPGAQQRVISATQTASHYAADGTLLGSVILQATIGQGREFLNSKGQLVAEPGATQPTFAILNPLAVRGGGVPIAFSALSPQTATTIGQFSGTAGADQDGVGPFRGITRPTPATMPNQFDLQAFSNGNRVYTTSVPIGNTPITTTGGRRRRAQDAGYPQHNVRITTATGMINDGSSGTNADPKSTAAFVTGSSTDTQNGLSATSTYGDYTLDIADRSDFGIANRTLIGLRMDKHVLGWNDNNGLFSTTTGTTTNPPNPTSGPGAMVNPLPWDTIPTSGSNHSSDYPDIGATAVSTLLKNTDISTQGGTPDAATLISGGTNVDARTVTGDATAIQVAVPKYQPANLQFFDQGDVYPTPIAPVDVNPMHTTFPMGYVARNVRIYDDPMNNGHWIQGDAYRTISVYSGVPVDLNTTIANTTTDLGKLPQGFGLQTENYPALGSFIPYPTSTEIAANAQTPGYTSFFKPLTILNQGNTNLLNVHVDQKLAMFIPGSGTTAATMTSSALPLLGDSLESLATIPSYDANALGTTGAVVPAPTSPKDYLPYSSILENPYLLRSSLDDDIITAYGRNPGLVAQGAPYNTLGATFHKPRVGDASPTTMTVPDIPHDNNPSSAGGYYLAPNSQVNASGGVTATLPPMVNSSGVLVTGSTVASASTDPQYPSEPAYGLPYIALAIPQGTPVGTYSQNVRVFEGVNTSSTTGQYDPLMPPTYGSNGVVINPYLNTNATGTMSDTFLRSAGGIPAQPYSTPTVVRATVTEGRITDGSANGSLPQVDSSAQNAGRAADFLPSAFRDPVTGNVSMYWVSSRYYTTNTLPPYNVFGANLAQTQNGAFEADTTNGTWLSSIGTGGGPLFTNTVPSGINTSISVAPDQVLYSSNGTPTTDHSAYAFVQNVVPQGTAVAYGDNLNCYEVTPGTGQLASGYTTVTSDPRTAKFGVHGLKFDTTFVDSYPGGTASIGNNLWAFWYSGSGSRSAIYYNSTTASGGAPGTFGTPAVLPVPAGLVSVSDPNAVLTYAPDANGNAVPVIEVTYTGIAADGNADIYVSRYQPYLVRNPQGTATTQVGLALVASPAITEQLQATSGNLYWQARDVGWARNANNSTGNIDVVANGIDLQLNAATAKAPTYDRATGTLVYTNISPNGSAGGGTPITVYVDLSHGRIRFSRPLVGIGNAAPTVYAAFSPQARRITTDPRADSAPVSFIDDSIKANEAGFDNAANGNSAVANVKADRYWFIWRKSGASGTSTQPTLWYKTQRLTLDLHSTANLPVSLTLNAQQQPANLTVKDNTTGTTLYSSGAVGNAQVDVDWARGRIYFPMVDNNGKPLEGNSITVTFTGTDSNGNAQTGVSLTDNVHWLDEPRANVPTTTNLAAVGSTTPSAGTTTPASAATGESEIPMDTTVNEGNVAAFLDPFASLTQPHKVWLFWTSTRNGTADIYYETIDPLFSASVGQ